MIPTVRRACELHPDATRVVVSDAIVRFDEVTGDAQAGRTFFATTYLTEGLTQLLTRAVSRLAGKTSESSFHLKQAMGGGKTHSITALSYLARHPQLRREVLPQHPHASAFGSVRFAAFNGRDRPHDFFWGRLLHQLGAAQFLRSDVTDPPDENAWRDAFTMTPDPVLIVLDELPPYFEMLNTQTVGHGTMADRAANAFAGMLSAAHRLPNVCVVVSDLAGTYGTGSSIILHALNNARGEIARQEVSITPVSLDSAEAYEILKKRLIRRLPTDTEIAAIADAYARALTAAGRASVVDKGAEKIADEIRITYPFHPETKHLFAMFKDNPGFRATRGLMELGSLMLRSVWDGDRDVHLIGPQHFDLSIPEVGERLGEISKLDAAIAKDIHDAAGGAAAQLIDTELGTSAGSEVAALLLTASLSTTGDANRGLRPRDAMSILVNPLGGEEAYQNALTKLYERAQYLHRSPEERYYFDRQVNLNALLSELARNAPENRVNEIIAARLKAIFEPRDKSAYEELVDGTEGIDRVADRIRQKRVLLFVRPDGQVPPTQVRQFFASIAEKNNVFILTGERSFEAHKLETAARELYATIAAERDIQATNPQRPELQERRQAAEQRLTAAVVGMYDRLLVPMQTPNSRPELRALPIQIHGGNDAERVIIDALKKPPRKLFTDITGSDFDVIRSKTEVVAWGAHDEAVYADVERRAREHAGAFWLPPGGMRTLRDTAVQRGIWEDLGNGRISKVVRPKRPGVQVSVARPPTAQDPTVILEIATVNAGPNAFVTYAENGAATRDSERVKGGQITSQAPVIGIFIVDPDRPNSPDAPNFDQTRWDSPLPIAHRIDPTPDGRRRVTLVAHEMAKLRYTLDGSSVQNAGVPYTGPFEIPPTRATLQVGATVTIGGALTFESSDSFIIPPLVGPQATDPWAAVDPAKPASLSVRETGTFAVNDRANVYQAVELMRAGHIRLRDADLRVTGNGAGGGVGFHARITGAAELRADHLTVLLEQAAALVNAADAAITIRFASATADNPSYLKDLDRLLQTPVQMGEVKQ